MELIFLKITKAVIPAAGFGTRVLPASKVLPKEMLPLVDKPAIQYIIEEAAASGITDILIITNRGKEIIENHFDKNPDLERNLEKSGKSAMLNAVSLSSNLANLYFIRQKEAKGLGHAISCAKTFVGNEPFAVLYGDDVITGKVPVCKQLIDAFNEYNLCVVGAKQMPEEKIINYGSLKVEPIKENILKCTDMIEKPSKDKIMSLYSILGRCILTPDIFDILSKTLPGHGGEIQLTDAMKVLAQRDGIIVVDFDGKRYDIGNKLGIMQANVEIALNHTEIGKDFKTYLKELCKSL